MPAFFGLARLDAAIISRLKASFPAILASHLRSRKAKSIFPVCGEESIKPLILQAAYCSNINETWIDSI